MALGHAGGVDRGAAGCQQHRQGLPVTVGSWGAEHRPGQRFPGGADRVELVVFGAVAPLVIYASAGVSGRASIQRRFWVAGERFGISRLWAS